MAVPFVPRDSKSQGGRTTELDESNPAQAVQPAQATGRGEPGPGRPQAQAALARALMYRNPAAGNKELATACGFADEYHFSKQFKRVAGMTPNACRAQ